MTLPELTDWKPTVWALHQAAMLLGPIHNALFTPRNNYLHLPMFVSLTGVRSQQLPAGGIIYIDFAAGQVVYRPGSGDTAVFEIAGTTQAALYEALLARLQQDELADFLAGAVQGNLAATLLEKLHADTSRTEFLKLEDVSRTEPLVLNPQTASDYAAMLYQVYTGVARFRARLTGHLTAMVVWPEHFDLSTLWFHPDNAAMDDTRAHINIGFTPYTPGQYEMPYFYAYAYPYPEGFEPPALPEPAAWHLEGWRGIVVTYDALREQPDLAHFVERLCDGVFPILQGIIA